jgi:hypothetical protein
MHFHLNNQFVKVMRTMPIFQKYQKINKLVFGVTNYT